MVVYSGTVLVYSGTVVVYSRTVVVYRKTVVVQQSQEEMFTLRKGSGWHFLARIPSIGHMEASLKEKGYVLWIAQFSETHRNQNLHGFEQ